jgi:hypothetical protein
LLCSALLYLSPIILLDVDTGAIRELGSSTPCSTRDMILQGRHRGRKVGGKGWLGQETGMIEQEELLRRRWAEARDFDREDE